MLSVVTTTEVALRGVSWLTSTVWNALHFLLAGAEQPPAVKNPRGLIAVAKAYLEDEQELIERHVDLQLMSAQIRQSIESVETLWAANESARVGIAQRWFPAGNESLEREIGKFSDLFKLMLRLHRAHVETPVIRT
jgi:hypothetical protein